MSSPASARDGRQTAAAFNHAETLRELVLEIRKLGVLYCVGKRRPISELTEEQQIKVREAYAETNWSSDYGIELQGIFTTRELAEKVCREHGKNWFCTRLPIDSCLPEEQVFGEWAHVFPGSDAVELYENMESATLAVPVSQMRAMEERTQELQSNMQMVEDEIARLQTIVKAVRNGLKPSP